ncbi:MAG: hypothetical protein ABSB00_02145 [Minisyncoccia bacterium]|jgi:hypothetical protein
MENKNISVNEGDLKRKRRHLLFDALYGTPHSKALHIAMIEARLDMVDGHERRIKELENRFKVKDNRIVDKVDKTYYYNGASISIGNRNTLYFNVFDVVFELMPDGGEKTYAEIETALRKRRIKGRKIAPKNGSDRDARIRTNLTSEQNGFFRYAKNIENSSSENRPLIEAKKGEGIIFNNTR